MKIICTADFSHYCGRIGAFDNLMAYVVGLQRFGHEVYLIDDVNPKRCFDDAHQRVPFEAWEGKHRFETLAKWYGVWPRCSVIYNQGEATHGMSMAEAIDVARTSDLLISLGRALKTREVLEVARCRAYVDLAPGKTQVYHAEYGLDYGLDQYEHFFSVGLNIGTPQCEIPACGVTWHGIFHPVVLDMWPAQIDEHCRRFTTISNWGKRHTFNFRGRYSGDKEDNWRRFVAIPGHTAQEMEIALNIDPAYASDLQLFQDNGWILSDPRAFRTLEDYRSYIGSSRAEFSIANDRVVQFNTAWFSERSGRYLASGKPVLLQSTGIEAHLPIGQGVLTFTTAEEALAGIEAINHDYLGHCRAARAIAEEYCDSDKVLSKMLTTMGFEPSASRTSTIVAMSGAE